MQKTTTKALIIFTRNPELGKCKTRLAKTIGDVSALNVYKHLLEHTANVSKEIDANRYVFYSVAIRTDDIWSKDTFIKQQQYGNDLGERMQNAFQQCFNDLQEKVLIIGSDLKDLNSKIIEDAYKALSKYDVVIGPAQDGGYYLLGMKKMIPEVFKNKSWGTETVFNDTISNLENFSVYKLPTLNDIDTFEDLKTYKELEYLYQ